MYSTLYFFIYIVLVLFKINYCVMLQAIFIVLFSDVKYENLIEY